MTSPDDIPTEITKLVYTLPLANSRAVSQNETATLLAHFWPAIRAHFLNEGAELIGAASTARLDEIDEDDLKPTHWERHQAWLDAASVLTRAAGTEA